MTDLLVLLGLVLFPVGLITLIVFTIKKDKTKRNRALFAMVVGLALVIIATSVDSLTNTDNSSSAIDTSQYYLAPDSNGVWFAYDPTGAVATTYTGVLSNDAGTWYVNAGKVDFGYSGYYTDTSGTVYTIQNGQVIRSHHEPNSTHEPNSSRSESISNLLLGIALLLFVLCILIGTLVIKKQREELLDEILGKLFLENIDSIVKEIDDTVTVKSLQALNNYTDIKYFKDNDNFESVKRKVVAKDVVRNRLSVFLNGNDFEKRPQYNFVKKQLSNYLDMAKEYRVLVKYITSAGNNRGQGLIKIDKARVDTLVAHPEYLMSKGEYNKLLKEEKKKALDYKKHSMYDRVNAIIDYANTSKRFLIVKSREKTIDDLVQKLFDRTVNSIQKVSQIDSDAWGMLEDYIATAEKQLRDIIENDKKIGEYYRSDDFAKIKETCKLLTQSQKDFNEYINEKAQSITQLFGTRTIRNETQNEDVFNYVRAYKKSITPFTAEVSSAVFGSAENNPFAYIIKYFYPDKSQYKQQIEKLKVLIEELETLKEAKEIIDNYKKDYAEYIQNVPEYVLKNDESGFYSRLGLAIIDESVLNVEYRFTYTSNGGMAQRSFSVPMNEENIIELINQLESKLSLEALAKEQRALMTSKLRTQIKERDNFTCCQCGNSVFSEPNLLLEIDHIIPVSKGGLTREDNLQTLCWKCNRAKGAKLVV